MHMRSVCCYTYMYMVALNSALWSYVLHVNAPPFSRKVKVLKCGVFKQLTTCTVEIYYRMEVVSCTMTMYIVSRHPSYGIHVSSITPASVTSIRYPTISAQSINKMGNTNYVGSP